MKITVLASGSKGNCTYIETKTKKILIDMGMTCKYIEQQLNNINVHPSEIDIILITHDHNDHIGSLKVFSKKYKPTIYATYKTTVYLEEHLIATNIKVIEPILNLETTTISIIKTSHDALDPIGFIIEENNSSLVYITDTGYINKKYFDQLHNKTTYIIESNHDIEMLMNGNYRHDLKMRILSDKGHLSNETATQYLSDFIGSNTKYIILAHLSKENNTAEKAYNTLKNKLLENNKSQINIFVAKQDERMETIEI